MGQFKPMVKMMTTEPSVELKLKKGGAVAMKKGGSTKAVKMLDGGLPPMRATAPMAMGRPAPRMPMRAARPMRPMQPARPMMKEGGETKAEHAAEMKKMMGTEKKLKEHAAKPASKAHKGLKTGGVIKGQGGYKTGGVVNGQGGYKKGGKVKMAGGGCYANGGIVGVAASEKGAKEYKNTKMVTTKPDHSPAKTGSVKLGNGGGYKKGGAAKKYAKGGAVNDSGKAEKMPQGRKKPSTPVSINQLSGSFKKGGSVMTPAEKRLTKVFDSENAPAMKAAKSKDVEIYSKYGKQMRHGGKC